METKKCWREEVYFASPSANLFNSVPLFSIIIKLSFTILPLMTDFVLAGSSSGRFIFTPLFSRLQELLYCISLCCLLQSDYSALPHCLSKNTKAQQAKLLYAHLFASAIFNNCGNISQCAELIGICV